VGYYSFGPPFGFVSRVTNINITRINNFVKTVNLTRINNALPPERLLRADPALRTAVPADLREGRRLTVHPVTDVARAERQLVHPTAVAPPPNVPKVTAQIPKAVERAAPGRVSPRTLERAKGMGLLPSAGGRVTPQGRREMRALPQVEQPSRMVPKPEFRPGAPAAHEARPAPPHEVKPTPPHEVRPLPREVRPPGREFQPAPRETFRPPPAASFHAAPAPSFHPAPAPQFHPSMPREFTPAPRPEFHAPSPAFRPAPAPAPRAVPAPRGAAPGRR
jgi:hypothetical protein